MPKRIVNAIGLIATLGVIAIALLAFVLPQYTAAQSRDNQTRTVAQTNTTYRVQIESLLAAQARQGEIETSVAGLREQVPTQPLLDDVFEIVAKAATSTGVTITNVLANELEPWVAPWAPETPAPAPTDDATGTGTGGNAAAEPAGGRQMVTFSVTITAQSMVQAQQFVDALRDGTRLVATTSVAFSQGVDAVDADITIVTFVDQRS
jgi:type II secretory pathway pseudopilin PulG